MESVLKALWRYDERDKTTWKYLGYKMAAVSLGRYGKHMYVIQWIDNPDFQYSHLETKNPK